MGASMKVLIAIAYKTNPDTGAVTRYKSRPIIRNVDAVMFGGKIRDEHGEVWEVVPSDKAKTKADVEAVA